MAKRNQDNRHGDDQSDEELGEMLAPYMPPWQDDDGLITRPPASPFDQFLDELTKSGVVLTKAQKRFADIFAWVMVVLFALGCVIAVIFILAVIAVGIVEGIFL